MGLESQVLKRVVPSPEEEARIRATVEDVRGRVSAAIKERGVDAEPLLVGSVAKGTHLSDPEIDMFVAFPRETPREVLERVGLELGEFLKDRVRQYAEHPYTRGRWNGLEVEIVPCYRIEDASQKMSAVDRTPLHAAYVVQKIGPKQRDEVRLLKAFCEGIGVYGAEAKVQGFSGYLCELLGLRYGTFRGVLEASLNWRRGVVIALEPVTGKDFPDPFVVIDPIDAERNVASAVSEESLATFIYAAKSFLEKPRIEFFFPKPRKPLTAVQARQLLKRRGTTLVGVTIPAPKLTDDILYPQVRKALRAIEDLLRKADFRIMRSRFAVTAGVVLLVFEFEVFALPAARKHRGPPAWVKNADEFLSRWRRAPDALSWPYIEGGNWGVDVRRKATDGLALIHAQLHELSLGSHLDRNAGRARLMKDAQLFTKTFLSEVTSLLDPRFPWDRPS